LCCSWWLFGVVGCDSDAADDLPAVDAARVEAEAEVGRDAEPSGPDAAAPWIEIGTGARRFEALEAGQEVPVIAGIQGGFHVWGGLRGGGFTGTEAVLDFELHLGDQRLAWAEYTEPQLPKGSDGAFDYAGVAVVYARNDDVEPTSGRSMRLSVRVRDAEGVDLTDAVELVPVCCQ